MLLKRLGQHVITALVKDTNAFRCVAHGIVTLILIANAMPIRHEVIGILSARPIKFDVTSTVHGPLVAIDRLNRIGYALHTTYRGREADILSALVYAHIRRSQTL